MITSCFNKIINSFSSEIQTGRIEFHPVHEQSYKNYEFVEEHTRLSLNDLHPEYAARLLTDTRERSVAA